MRLSLIVAVAENGIIGRDGGMPWRLSSDLRRFKRLTMGHTIIMGRRTFESIGRLLPGRRAVVVTRQADFDAMGAPIASGLEAAIELAGDDSEAFVIGGGEIYRLALPRAQRLYVTLVHAQPDGDTRFPDWRGGPWRLVEEERIDADDKNQFPSSFRIYDRVR